MKFLPLINRCEPESEVSTNHINQGNQLIQSANEIYNTLEHFLQLAEEFFKKSGNFTDPLKNSLTIEKFITKLMNNLIQKKWGQPRNRKELIPKKTN